MNTDDRIDILVELGNRLKDPNNENVEKAIIRGHHENQWFIPENSRKSINAICAEFLNKEDLTKWVNKYNDTSTTKKKVGIVMAGNIPLVGFHDLLCSFISGHNTLIKTSSKDDVLTKMVVEVLSQIDPRVSSKIEIVDKLSGFDAVIATGSNNTAHHFQYYFRDHPSIIRKNRTSVAVAHGAESKIELALMGIDVFDYFGLGCRNVSKLYLPEGFVLDTIFEALFEYKHVIDHNKYKNNYDYNEAIYLMGQDPFLTNGFIMLREDESLHSRIACLHYEYYEDLDSLITSLNTQRENIQCIASQKNIGDLDVIPFGQCQAPGLMDYADGVDTMAFLNQL